MHQHIRLLLLLLGLLVVVYQCDAQQHEQLLENLPEDVELLGGHDATTGKLGRPFNQPTIYESYGPSGVVLQPELVRQRSRVVMTLMKMLSQMTVKRMRKFIRSMQQPNGAGFRAAATLFGDNAEAGPMGQIAFTQYGPGQSVIVTINATGLPAGKHAIHIHAFGDLREGCKSTGPHMRNILVSGCGDAIRGSIFRSKMIGLFSSPQIGNVEVKEDGKLELNFHSPYLTLFGPNKGIIGRSIVIHEKPIEFNRFPDIRGYPVAPTLNQQQVQSEEMAVGGFVACGIITVTNTVL